MTVLHVCAFAVVSLYTCMWLPIWRNGEGRMKINCKVPQPFPPWVAKGTLTSRTFGNLEAPKCNFQPN